MLKSLLQKSFKSLGFDLVSIANLEQEIQRRERVRQKESLMEFRRLRELPKKNGGNANISTLWVSREEMLSAAVELMRQADVILDIGCAFRPQQYIEARTHICCEPYSEYMDRLQLETSGDGKYIYLNTDFVGATNLFPEKSVDSIFMVDVIEHIDREIGQAGIERLKKIARTQVIISTPLGYMDQEPCQDGIDPWGMGGVEWQKHRSGWLNTDFPITDGWTTVGCRDFHLVDGYGEPLEKTVGAFWAIWNC